MAIENLTATTLRNIIGDMELDATLTSREIINTKMRASLDEATDPWGIKVTRVELKNIIPPAAIQEAMEKQMKAERERREKILQAEGEKKSKAFLGGVLSGVVEPIGAVLTLAAAQLILPALPYLLSFAAGAMLYVVIEEMIPEMSQGKHSNIGTLFFAVGFSIMMMLDVALG